MTSPQYPAPQDFVIYQTGPVVIDPVEQGITKDLGKSINQNYQKMTYFYFHDQHDFD